MRRHLIIWTTFFLAAIAATQISPSPYGDERGFVLGPAIGIVLPNGTILPIEGRQTAT